MTMPKMHNGTNWDTIGKSGRDGQTVLSGSGAPAVGLGKINDFYIDKAVWNIYGPKTSGGWGSATSLVGAPSSLYDANTILAANADNTPLALTVPAATLLGRAASGNIAALSAATVRSDFDLAQASRVGNLLTANQASIETDTAGFTALANATISQSSSNALHGSKSLRVTAVAAGATFAWLTWNRCAVTPGQVITGYVGSGVSASGSPSAIGYRLYFYRAAGTAISYTAGVIGSSVTAVAPAESAYSTIWLMYTASEASDAVDFDCLGLWAGAGGEWAMPGTPITNLGTKITHPNVDDVLVQKWAPADSVAGTPARWQTVHYDSGWRNVSGLFTPGSGMSAIGIRIRRVNSNVYMSVQWEQDATAGSTGTAAVPTGFRIDSNVAVPTRTILNFDGTRMGAIAISTNYSLYPVMNRGPRDSGFSYNTSDTLPTTLPGTLVSQAPA